MTFPDLPRLELDELLGQVVERAQEVMATQGRLRGLLHANQMIVGHLALPVVLRRIVEAAKELIGANYAALGVIASDGFLAEFIHVGMETETVARIGRLPQGKGLLGALIDDPKPIRLREIASDSRSSGFPKNHPPMGSFLGVPIRVRDEVFGNLYFTESTNGEFSAEDEELAKALAASAGVAIDNARLYEAARTRQEWLQASSAITRQLLAADPGRPLTLIADRSREIADADVVTVLLPAADQPDELQVDVAVGTGSGELLGFRLPIEGSLSGRVFTSAEPLRMSTTGEQQPGLAFRNGGTLDLGPVLVLPLVGSQRVHGVLTVARLSGRAAFSAEDLDMAAGFANQAAVALELAEARNEHQRAAMLDERERIAADLHDHVIQSLFAAGLTLQAVATRMQPGPATDRILTTITGLDDTIRQIRTSIFQLNQAPLAAKAGIRMRVLDAVADVARGMHFEPAVRFDGLMDDIASDAIADDVVAVLHEALSNVARHSAAQSADVDISTVGGELVIRVSDDGRGMGPGDRRSGLANLRRRAERHGGTLTVTAREPTGTTLRWSAPLSH